MKTIVQDNNKNNFLCPTTPYHGNNKSQKLLFNDRLQEFSHKVSYIAGLYSNGKISATEAQELLENNWHVLHILNSQNN